MSPSHATPLRTATVILYTQVGTFVWKMPRFVLHAKLSGANQPVIVLAQRGAESCSHSGKQCMKSWLSVGTGSVRRRQFGGGQSSHNWSMIFGGCSLSDYLSLVRIGSRERLDRDLPEVRGLPDLLISRSASGSKLRENITSKNRIYISSSKLHIQYIILLPLNNFECKANRPNACEQNLHSMVKIYIISMSRSNKLGGE